MELRIYPDKQAGGAAAAERIADLIRQAISQQGAANIIVATGASQFEMFSHIVTLGVDWSKVTVFHLDEYIGLPVSHPASFRRYLRERFIDRLPELHQFHEINAEGDPLAECRRLGDLIRRSPVDVACVGIGENGHLAFNDPPADFITQEPYIVVNLDAACRQQQVGEGWFAALQDVPKQAISMSIQQIMKSAAIVCTVPDARKASAVQKTVEGPLTNLVPASILQQHPRVWLFLDEPAAAGLTRRS
jgi:glucosamine-6-phosphate deaminase